jgi:hypothetical protein
MGYVISEQFKEMGGPAGLQAMCQDCPANAGRPFPAGCVGRLGQRPWCHETQEELEAVISQWGLQTAVDETFVATTPIWFGLWTRSPLSARAAGLLVTLLTGLMDKRGGGPSPWLPSSWRAELQQFIAAARIAESGTARLHVSMAPPGHTDFGWYTIFAHCPLCKAEAEVERWKRKAPVALYTCEVCGTRYSPAEQASAKHFDYEPGPELREVLGQSRFRGFAHSYLVARGLSEADAAETVNLSEAAAVEGQKNLERMRREQEALRRYIEESLYEGLHLETLADPDDPERALAKGFRAGEFEELMRRCTLRKIRIVSVHHNSLSEEMERHTYASGLSPEGKRFDPAETYENWRAEGCNELFQASFEIPPDLVAAFEQEPKGGG